MTSPIQALRGMNDILPHETFLWHRVEKILQDVLHSYGYREIRLPLLEKTELFKRSIGEITDIVEKEMYTFLDRNNESVTLRPEETASCVRAGIEHGLFYNQIQRLWYAGPCFRYERPQKGRYRQFYQWGAEAFGMPGPDIDAELILLSARIIEKCGLKSVVTLQLNSLGSPESRKNYREKVVSYFTTHHAHLDEDSQRRLSSNPLRILDSKNPAMQQFISDAPQFIHYLDSESEKHFNELQNILKDAKVDYSVNPRLVRGLDYYTKTVFEWVTNELGAQGTVCAGGRYDGLIEQLGGKPTPALGFALGVERMVLLMQKIESLSEKGPDIYFMTEGEKSLQKGLQLADHIRDALPTWQILFHCGGGNLKNQFKKADKSGARFALILGEQELATQSISLKSLRENIPQVILSQDMLLAYLVENHVT